MTELQHMPGSCLIVNVDEEECILRTYQVLNAYAHSSRPGFNLCSVPSAHPSPILSR